ncbi:MAG: ABC transporter permease [Candidatus Kapaibacterium sp.]
MKADFSKIMTIIRHEYLIRVRSKGFIIGTLLGPLGLIVMVGIIAFTTYLTIHEEENKQIAIKDQSGLVAQGVVERDAQKYYISDKTESELRQSVLEGKIDGYILIPADILQNGEFMLYGSGGGGLNFTSSIESDIGRVVRHQRMLEAGVNQDVVDLVNKRVEIMAHKVTEEGTEKDYSEAFSGLGYVLGLVIYGMMFIYGGMVLRGVIEEKSNRIIEVIASSARPFEIMTGKVVGIGAIGLTQVLIWIIMAGVVFMAAGPIINSIVTPDQMAASMPGAQAGIEQPQAFEMPSISPWLAVGFVFYFLFGYFIYATLFAAVGSAVDQESDAQQLQWPVTIPIIIPMLFLAPIMNNPDGTLAVVMSLIPFFSPILMILRIAATNVPVWQIALSVVLMVGTFFGSVWVAARIYRIGILMYGKKPDLKDLLKWARMSK